MESCTSNEILSILVLLKKPKWAFEVPLRCRFVLGLISAETDGSIPVRKKSATHCAYEN